MQGEPQIRHDHGEIIKSTLTPKKNKWQKVCVIKHAFTLEDKTYTPDV
jgi:hypothetical protein